MTRRADHAHYGWRHGRVIGAVRLAVMEMNAGKFSSSQLSLRLRFHRGVPAWQC